MIKKSASVRPLQVFVSKLTSRWSKRRAALPWWWWTWSCAESCGCGPMRSGGYDQVVETTCLWGIVCSRTRCHSLSAHYVLPKEGRSLRWWGLDEREAAWPHAWHACIVLQLAPRGSPPDGHIDTGNHNSPTQITGGSTLYSLLRLSRETSSSSQFLGNDSTCYVCGWDLHGTCHSRLLGH